MFGNGPIPPIYNTPYPNYLTNSLTSPSVLGRGSGIGLFNRASSPGILAKLKSSGVTLSGILTNTQKTLGVVKEAIPIIKQTGPMINNMKTMFKVANAFKNETTNTNTTTTTKKTQTTNTNNSKKETLEKTATSTPDFFI